MTDFPPEMLFSSIRSSLCRSLRDCFFLLASAILPARLSCPRRALCLDLWFFLVPHETRPTLSDRGTTFLGRVRVACCFQYSLVGRVAP